MVDGEFFRELGGFQLGWRPGQRAEEQIAVPSTDFPGIPIETPGTLPLLE